MLGAGGDFGLQSDMAHPDTSTCCSSLAFSSGSASIAKKPAAISVPARYFSRSRVRYGG